MRFISQGDLKKNLRRWLEIGQFEIVVITRDGRPAMVMVPIDVYKAMGGKIGT